MRSAMLSGFAFLVGYVLPALGVLLFYSVQQQGQGMVAARGEATTVIYLAVVQAILGAIVYAFVTALGRRWRLRSRNAKLVVSVVAGAVAYLLSWTGLVALGLLARGAGDGVLQRAGGDVAGWILAAWPGLLAGLVVLVGAAMVALPAEAQRQT